MEKLVVMGLRVNQFSEERAEHIEISLDDIENSGATNLAEILETIPGIRVTRGMRGETVTIMGMSSKYLKVLVNGAPLSGRLSGSYDLTRIKLHNVKRIEIIKGPSSSLHGADAMGGMINVVIDWSEMGSHQGGVRSSTTGRYSSFGQYNSRRKNSQFHLGVDYGRGVGYTVKDRFGTFKAPHLEEAGVRIQYALDSSENNTLSLIGDYQFRKFHSTDYYDTGAVFDRSNDILNANVQLQNDYSYSEFGTVKLKVAHNQHLDNFVNNQRRSDALDAHEDTKQKIQTYGIDVVHKLISHELAMGVEHTVYGYKSDRLASGTEYGRNGFAVYLQDRWKIRDFLLTFGVRQEDDSQFGNHVSRKIEVNYKLNELSRVLVSYSEGFRAPSFKELYMSFVNSSVGYEVAGNGNLKPEDSQFYSIEYRASRKNWSWSLKALQNDVNNLIDTVLTEVDESTRQHYRYQNVYRAQIRGGEAGLQYHGSRTYSLKLGHSYIEARNSQSNTLLSGRPINSTKLGFLWTPATAIRVSLNISHYGKRLYYEDSQIWRDPYTNGKIASNYEIDAHISIQLGINNIFNVGDSAYLPMEPFSIYGGLTFGF